MRYRHWFGMGAMLLCSVSALAKGGVPMTPLEQSGGHLLPTSKQILDYLDTLAKLAPE